MHLESEFIKKPQNENIKIWRYMDFTKFVSLLETKSLYYARSDKFEDRFEGSLTQMNIHNREIIFQDISPEFSSITKNSIKLNNQKFREFVFINCWHINEYESAAMWKLYSNTNESVAIQSTYLRLCQSFEIIDTNIFVGQVKYIDYSRDHVLDTNAFDRFYTKRKSFEHEHELIAPPIKYRTMLSHTL